MLVSNEGHATYLMGSDLAWECLGSDKYKVTVRVYRDCNGNNLANTKIKFLGNCSGITTSSQTMSPGRDVTPVCRGQKNRCSSSSSAFQYGIEEYKLVTTLDISSFKKNGCCEVTITWSQCCRNRGINTGAASQNFYTEGRLNVCQSPCDNSPVFNSQAVSIFCLGRDVIINAGAHDIDTINGRVDSLVYSFADPNTSASSKTTWKSPFSSQKPISYLGFPKTYPIDKFPFGFHLDSVTGQLMFRPMKLEQTVLVIKVEEYRNGKKIGQVRRDAQIIIIKCSNNTPPVISGVNCAKPKQQNFTMFACAGATVCFNICTSDGDKNDTVTIGWDRGIPDASFTVANQGKLKREIGRFCWTPSSYSPNKPHRFVVTAKDNSCPVNGISQRVFTIYVSDSSNSGVAFSQKPIKKECRIYELMARTSNKSKYDHWTWYAYDSIPIGYTSGLDSSQITYTFKNNGRIPIKLVADRGGCSHVFYDTIEISGTSPIKHRPLVDTSICLDKNYSTPIVVTGGNKPLTYSWELDDSLYTSDTIEFVFNGSVKSGTINYFIEDSLGCKEEHTFYILNKLVQTTKVEYDRFMCQNSSNKKINLKTESKVNGKTIHGQWTGIGTNDSIFDGTNLPSGLYPLAYYGETKRFCVADSMSVDIRNNPKVDAGKDRFFCLSTSPIKLGGYPWKGTWRASGTKVVNGVFYPSLSDSFKNTILYQYNDRNGCSTTDKVIFTRITHKPFVNAEGHLEICDNDSIKLKQGLPVGGIWTSPIITSRHFNTTFVVMPRMVNQNTIYQANYEIEDENGCKNSDAIEIMVKPSPKVTIPKQIDHCFSGNLADTAILTGTPSGGKWTGKGTFLSDTSLKIGRNSLGNHPVSYTYVAPNGCIDNANTVLTVRGKPSVNVSDDTFCVKTLYPYTFDASPNGGIWSGPWISEQNGTYTSHVGENRLGIFTYHYKYTDKYGCFANRSMQLSVGSRTTSEFIPSTLEGNAPLLVSFQNRSENGKHYVWNFGNGSANFGFEPKVTYQDSGTFITSLTVRDSTGFCKSQSSQEITVSPSSSVENPESKLLVSIYPSPASNKIMIENLSKQVLQFSIVSANGQVLLAREISHDATFDVSSLAPGVYIFKAFSHESQLQMGKLVIE